MERLLLATNNKGKIREFKSLLEGLPLEIVAPESAGLELSIEEGSSSYRENAVAKALAGARASGILTLAEDSGLEVTILGGEPGVHSARYAGPSDEDRIKRLLSRLEGFPWEKRKAAFHSVIAIARPDGKVKTFSGLCHGFIAFQPQGKGGFGYDPIFFIPRLGKTMAELFPEEKNKISHRGRAVRRGRDWLKDLLSSAKIDYNL